MSNFEMGVYCPICGKKLVLSNIQETSVRMTGVYTGGCGHFDYYVQFYPIKEEIECLKHK